MRRLHHTALCPFSRFIRLLLAEKQLDVILTPERLLDQDKLHSIIEPAGKLPHFVDSISVSGESTELSIAGAIPIALYLDEAYAPWPLMGTTPQEKATILEVTLTTLVTLFYDVVHPLLDQKIYRRLLRTGPPDATTLRTISQRLHHHLTHIAWRLSHNGCLINATLTGADFAAAAQISLLDYMGAIDWSKHEQLALWYARLKSRPSFRPLLEEQIAGIVPPPHYAQLDF